jgi:hypothetical protein
MSYRAVIKGSSESVQDMTLSAERRLEEAESLLFADRPHSAVYLAGLAAEMYLKAAVAHALGALPYEPIDAHLGPLKKAHAYKGPLASNFESGHGLLFWSSVLLLARQGRGLTTAPSLQQNLLATAAALFQDWVIDMRYRPGTATPELALTFLVRAGWLKRNFADLYT